MKSILVSIIKCARLALEQMQKSLIHPRVQREMLLAQIANFNATWNNLSVEQKQVFVDKYEGIQQVRKYDQAVYQFCLYYYSRSPMQPNYHSLRGGVSRVGPVEARVRALDEYVTNVTGAIAMR